MPPIRTARNRKPPPAGFDDLEDTLLEFSNKMKDAENASHEGKKKYEVLWPIFQISHQRTSYSSPRHREIKYGFADLLLPLLLGSRYIYELYYEKEAISKELYDFLLKNKYADANLIAKWKKQGYEKVSSLRFEGLLFRKWTKLTDSPSCVVCAVSKRKRLISIPRVSVECPRLSSRRIRRFSVSAVAVTAVEAAIKKEAGVGR